MEQLLMYFGRHKQMETNVVKGHFATKSFRHWDVSGLRLFSVLSHSKTGQGITMAETLIIILAEHNVPINFADHCTKLVSNKLVLPDSVFLHVCAARAPCSLKVVIARIVTNFFSRILTGLLLGPLLFFLYINDITSDIESEIRLFADDCVCYHEIKDEEDTMKLQRDIDRLGCWARKWGMRFQPVKCSMMQWQAD